MGRIQKKKDPDKKKAQRTAKADSENGTPKFAESASPAKVVPAIKKATAIAKPKASVQDQNFLQKSVQFLREVKIELKKVTWPSRKQTMGSTAVVLVLVMIISLFLGLVDFGLSSLIRTVLP